MEKRAKGCVEEGGAEGKMVEPRRGRVAGGGAQQGGRWAHTRRPLMGPKAKERDKRREKSRRRRQKRKKRRKWRQEKRKGHERRWQWRKRTGHGRRFRERGAHQATRVEVMRTGDGGREAVFWTWDKSRTENVEWQHAHGRGDATKQETTQEGEEQEVKRREGSSCGSRWKERQQERRNKTIEKDEAKRTRTGVTQEVGESRKTPRKRDDMGEMMGYLQKVERIAQDVSADGES